MALSGQVDSTIKTASILDVVCPSDEMIPADCLSSVKTSKQSNFSLEGISLRPRQNITIYYANPQCRRL